MVNGNDKTIKVTKEVKHKLDKLKVHKNQSYNEIIESIINSIAIGNKS